MMKLMTAVLALGLAGAAYANDEHAGHGGGKKAEKGMAPAAASMTGEIVDLACYMAHEGKGEKHATCAKQCITGGAPMGLATDGGVYLLVNDHKAEKAYNVAKELAGGKAKITGKLSKRGGLQALIVSSAEAAK